MKICGIYKITSPNKKVYIGQSVDVNKRWNRYVNLHCKGQKLLYRSLKKYGIKNHNFEVICQCDESELNNLEIYYIELYQCFNSEYGLNLKSGGSNATHICSVETKKKLSEKRKGFKFSEESIKKMSDSHKGKVSPCKGRKLSEEHKQKLSLAKLGKKRLPMTDETKKKIGEANRLKGCLFENGNKNNLGKHHSKETKEKLRLLNLGKKRLPFSDETKKKMSIAKLGFKHSEETKKKISSVKLRKNINI